MLRPLIIIMLVLLSSQSSFTQSLTEGRIFIASYQGLRMSMDVDYVGTVDGACQFTTGDKYKVTVYLYNGSGKKIVYDLTYIPIVTIIAYESQCNYSGRENVNVELPYNPGDITKSIIYYVLKAGVSKETIKAENPVFRGYKFAQDKAGSPTNNNTSNLNSYNEVSYGNDIRTPSNLLLIKTERDGFVQDLRQAEATLQTLKSKNSTQSVNYENSYGARIRQITQEFNQELAKGNTANLEKLKQLRSSIVQTSTQMNSLAVANTTSTPQSNSKPSNNQSPDPNIKMNGIYYPNGTTTQNNTAANNAVQANQKQQYQNQANNYLNKARDPNQSPISQQLNLDLAKTNAIMGGNQQQVQQIQQLQNEQRYENKVKMVDNAVGLVNAIGTLFQKEPYKVAAEERSRAYREEYKRKYELLEQQRATDRKEVVEKILMPLADQGDIISMLKIAVYYRWYKNDTEAEKWYLKAATSGSGYAMGQLAELILRNNPQDTLGFYWYEQGAEKADFWCLTQLSSGINKYYRESARNDCAKTLKYLLMLDSIGYIDQDTLYSIRYKRGDPFLSMVVGYNDKSWAELPIFTQTQICVLYKKSQCQDPKITAQENVLESIKWGNKAAKTIEIFLNTHTVEKKRKKYLLKLKDNYIPKWIREAQNELKK